VDNNLPFNDQERLYPSLSVEANGVKERMEVVITIVESFDSSETVGGAGKDGAGNEPNTKYHVSMSEEPPTPEEEDNPIPEQKEKKRNDKGEDEACHTNSDGNSHTTGEASDNVQFLKVTPGRKKQHQTVSEDEDYVNNNSSYNNNKEVCKIALRVEPTEMCTLASKVRDYKGIDRMQPVAPFLHEFAIDHSVGPKCLRFSTEMGDISVPDQTRGRELMRKSETVLVVEVQDRDGTKRKWGMGNPATPTVQLKSNIFSD
jgi:hypothetical protein